jgi:hypothetical protein
MVNSKRFVTKVMSEYYETLENAIVIVAKLA